MWGINEFCDCMSVDIASADTYRGIRQALGHAHVYTRIYTHACTHVYTRVYTWVLRHAHAHCALHMRKDGPTDHKCIGHSCIGHNYIDHNYIDHNHTHAQRRALRP